jgi:glycosyltransferase involved in cell wall biosynthesis
VSMRRRPTILAFGLNAWDGYWQTRQHVLSRLARRGWPVGYTTPAMSIWDRNELQWRDAAWRSRRVERDAVQIWYPGRLPAQLHRWQAMDLAIMRRQARAFASSMVSPPDEVPIAYVFHPLFWPYVQGLARCRVVYHADDRFTAMRASPSEMAEIVHFERALCERADRIFAVTPGVAKGLGEGAAGKTVIVPNGADAERYQSALGSAVPADLAAIPRPRIAYAGSLNEKIDFALIARLARARPNIQWLLIGPVWSERQLSSFTRARLAECRQQANVRFLGVKDYRDLPAYCAHVDANAMFYRTDGDGWWRDIYPLKLHECLATGRPLLSSDVVSVREFADVVMLCRSDDEWLAAVDAAVSEHGVGSPPARIAVARANCWDQRIDQIEHTLDELTGSRSRPA